jgi:hypothetical protein
MQLARPNTLIPTYVFYSPDGGGHPFIFGARVPCEARLKTRLGEAGDALFLERHTR